MAVVVASKRLTCTTARSVRTMRTLVRSLACLPACLLACLPACLLACLPACLLACLPACPSCQQRHARLHFAGVYGDLVYNKLALDIVAQHDPTQGSLFMYYAAQVMHAPNEAPAQYVNLVSVVHVCLACARCHEPMGCSTTTATRMPIASSRAWQQWRMRLVPCCRDWQEIKACMH